MSALSTSTTTGWCPFATPYATPNYWPGNSGRRAVCLHIMDGTYNGTVGWFQGASSGVSAHFAIAKDGRIAQFVSIDDSAWANGADYANGHWLDPEGNIVNPSWADIVLGINPNRDTISIEHEGTPQDVWTDAMRAANTRLLQWLASQVPAFRPYTPHRNLIGHNEISPISRPNCPGPHCDLNERAAAANGAAASDDWALWGPLPLNKQYAIPQAWYPRARDLGAALSNEVYPVGGTATSVQLFQNGVGIYHAGAARVWTYAELKL